MTKKEKIEFYTWLIQNQLAEEGHDPEDVIAKFNKERE